MADQPSIFTNTDGTTQPLTATETVQTQEPSPVDDGVANLLTTIVTEDGRQKYSDVATALGSIPHANAHIQQLELEMSGLKEELIKRKSAEEVLAAFESKAPEAVATTTEPQVDYAAIAQLVNTQLDARQTKGVQVQNLQSVTDAFGALYGEKAEQVFYDTAKGLGLNTEQINSLAATSPQAALKLLGVDEKGEVAPTKTTNGVNMQAYGTSNEPQKPSAHVPFGASTKTMVDAWRAAGQQD